MLNPRSHCPSGRWRAVSYTHLIDYKQMGVGGDDSWGAMTHPEYTLPSGKVYVHRFALEPFHEPADSNL